MTKQSDDDSKRVTVKVPGGKPVTVTREELYNNPFCVQKKSLDKAKKQGEK